MYNKLLLFICFFVLVNCNEENINSQDPNFTYEYELTEDVLVHDQENVYNNLVLICPNGGKTPYLVDKGGNIKYSWSLDAFLGNDFELLPNGKTLGIFKSINPAFSFGGYGGVINLFDQNNILEWTYEVSNEIEIAHHDVELLKNGNIMIIVWEKI